MDVETAIQSLHSHGFDMKSVSVVGRDIPGERDVVGCYRVGGSCRYRGPLGAFWEGLWEFLDGFGFFWVPDLGWILMAGPFAGWVVTNLENSSIFCGLTAVGSAFYSIGISRDDILQYEASLKDGGLLLIIHGSATTVENARRLFDQLNDRQAF